MNTSLETVANIIASIIWADGDYAQQERAKVIEIATALELDAAFLLKNVEEAGPKLKELSAEQSADFLNKEAVKVDPADAVVVLEVVLELTAADGVVAEAEVEVILNVAASLGIKPAKAVMLLADLIADPQNFKVELN